MINGKNIYWAENLQISMSSNKRIRNKRKQFDLRTTIFKKKTFIQDIG